MQNYFNEIICKCSLICIICLSFWCDWSSVLMSSSDNKRRFAISLNRANSLINLLRAFDYEQVSHITWISPLNFQPPSINFNPFQPHLNNTSPKATCEYGAFIFMNITAFISSMFSVQSNLSKVQLTSVFSILWP